MRISDDDYCARLVDQTLPSAVTIIILTFHNYNVPLSPTTWTILPHPEEARQQSQSFIPAS